MAARKPPKTPDSTVTATARTAQASVLPPASDAPTPASVLAAISAGRLLDLCRLLGCEVREISGGKDRVVAKLSDHLRGRLPALLRELGRNELRLVSRRSTTCGWRASPRWGSWSRGRSR